MKIVIPGGSGQVGTVLARAFHASGDEVVVLSRTPSVRSWRVVTWDGATQGSWTREIDGADVVINLTGRSVNCRYNAANRREILESRVVSTRIVGEAIARASRPPHTWIQASTATIYGHRYSTAATEADPVGVEEEPAPHSWGFSLDVANAWESALNHAKTPATRKIVLRKAMTMSPDRGGIFAWLLGLVRFGLGGATGDGRQFVSWTHEHDVIAAVRWLIERRDIAGIVNLSSPNPLPNADFMRILREAYGRSFGLPTATWMLETGAIFLRTESELILKSRKVVPARLLESGFRFRYAEWSDAARALCQRRAAIP